jgi:hypothetical protein
MGVMLSAPAVGSTPALRIDDARGVREKEHYLSDNVTKAAATPKPPAPANWLSDLHYFDDDSEQNEYIRCLVVGKTGSGKTHFAGTWPSPLVLDFDKGGQTLRKAHIPYIGMYEVKGVGKRTFDIVAAALLRAKLDLPGGGVLDFATIKTIVFDSISLWSKAALDDFMLQAGQSIIEDKPGYDGYGKLLNASIELARRWIRLSTMYNVVVNALPDVNPDDIDGAKSGGALVEGKFRNLIGPYFDEVYYLESMKPNDPAAAVKYALYTAKKGLFEAKTRLSLPYKIEDPTYAKLYAAKVGTK